MDELERWKNSPIWDAEPTKHKYFYPVSIDPKEALTTGSRLAVDNPTDETYRFGPFVCASSPQSHYGPWRNAIDLLVPDGTAVVAALDGVIVEIQEHSNEWGPAREYANTLNYVTIGHEGHEYTQYCHLSQWSVQQQGLVRGDKVKRGQRISTVGKTGWTDRDHLHFIAFRNITLDGPTPFPSGTKPFKSLRVRFKHPWLQRLANH
jgi:murein DD-endopeptidase MepM/ murein hydrolase activator NlpD